MQETATVRNVVLLGHGNSGKTSVAESLLFTAGKTSRLGRVDDGSSVLDYEPEEIKRKISISASCHQVAHRKHQIFLIDTPGDDNFFTETANAVRVADAGVLVLGAVLGVRSQTAKFVDLLRAGGLPYVVCVNKMDRERADFAKTVQQLKDELNLNPVVVFLPIGAETGFRGVVDVAAGKAFAFATDGSGRLDEIAMPQGLEAAAAKAREVLMEKVAETDEALLDAFLEEGALDGEQLGSGLRQAVLRGEIQPVLPAAATLNQGGRVLLDMVVDLLPSPLDRPERAGVRPGDGQAEKRASDAAAPFSAQVFKTMADPYAGRLTVFRVFSGVLKADSFLNASKDVVERTGHLFVLEGKEQKPVDALGPGMVGAMSKLKETTTGDTLCAESAPIVYPALVPANAVISFAVSAKKGEEDKLFAAITKLLDEDTSLRLSREAQTNETIMSGVGQIHLEVIGEKIRRKYGIDMELSLPKVPYRETIRGKARVQGRHKKQSGGRGQFGDVWIEMEPLPRGGGYVYEDKIVGGVVPKQYIPAVDRGIQEAMARGVIAGYPVVDMKVALVDGSYHTVDSSEMAFKVAGSLAFKKAVQEARPVLLEPIMSLTIWVPKENVGDIMGDLNGRRGRVMGMDSDVRAEVIMAEAPLVEVQSYAIDLTSMTGGKGSFAMHFGHYEEVPAHLAEKIIAAYQVEKE